MVLPAAEQKPIAELFRGGKYVIVKIIMKKTKEFCQITLTEPEVWENKIMVFHNNIEPIKIEI